MESNNEASFFVAWAEALSSGCAAQPRWCQGTPRQRGMADKGVLSNAEHKRRTQQCLAVWRSRLAAAILHQFVDGLLQTLVFLLQFQPHISVDQRHHGLMAPIGCLPELFSLLQHLL